jgi:uncharacterized protein
MPDATVPPLQFVLKVASRCNLNCTYCYVYNKGDDSWRSRPHFMSRETLEAALERIRKHCLVSGQEDVRLTFHGGEPCLLGPARFDSFCSAARSALRDVKVTLSVQTNGTLLDARWADVMAKHEVSVGISLDGPAAVNDEMRVDFAGRGTYARIAGGLELLREAGVELQILCVIHFGVDGRAVHRHLLELGADRINYLLPDFTHDSVQEIHARYGPTPCADYLLPILDDWCAAGPYGVRVSPFNDMARVILGGDTCIDLIGNRPYQYCFVETDGSIEGLDVLRVCGQGLAVTGLHVASDEFSAIAERSALHRKVMFEGPTLPTPCHACPERETCGGGYLPHRHSAARGFDNSSVWCQDLLALFGRLREYLDVSHEETLERRAALHVAGGSSAVDPSDRAAADAGLSLSEHADVLTWLSGQELSALAHDRWRSYAAGRLIAAIDRAEGADPDSAARCRAHLLALDDQDRARVELAPETTFRTVWRVSAPAREALAFAERALAVERRRLGHGVETTPGAWSALGDVEVTEDGGVRAGPLVDGLPPLDFDSPAACRLDLSGRAYTIERPREPLAGADRARVLRRLQAVAQGLAATGGTVAAFVQTFSKVIVLQPESGGAFSSGSNWHYVGRSAIGNPHSDRVDQCDLADAIVHESIHGLLYIHETGREWVTRHDLYDPVPALTSPWSGAALPVRPFLQACFVWYGLANFWAQALACGSFPRDRCVALLARASTGFLSKPLSARLAPYRDGLSDEVVEAIDVMQDDIRSTFRETA